MHAILQHCYFKARLSHCIPLTNRVRGFMAQARSARAMNRKGKNEDP